MIENKNLKDVLRQTAIVDIAINDLDLTLDVPLFFAPSCPFVQYGIDSEYANYIRYQTLIAMSCHLCMLEGGIDLAKQLAKKSGLLNYKLSDTVYVTEEYIENGMKNQLNSFINNEATFYDFQTAIYYTHLFEQYCLDYIPDDWLEERIDLKIKTYLKDKTDLNKKQYYKLNYSYSFNIL